MKNIIFSIFLILSGCTYDPPTKPANWYNNPETCTDDSGTHPRRQLFQAYLHSAVAEGLPGAVLLIRTPQARFQAELDTLQKPYKFPGATVAYILPDGTVEAIATGMDDVERKIPMTPQSRMLAASIGKMFAGATVVALYQEGMLSLDDPISKWLGDRLWFERLAKAVIAGLR